VDSPLWHSPRLQKQIAMPSLTLNPPESPANDLITESKASVSFDSAKQIDTLRVLHVINGEHYAGAERVQDLLALRLAEVGIEVEFACLKPDKFASLRACQATPLVSLPMRSRFDMRPIWKLARMLRAGRFHIVHSHTPRTAMAAHLAARLAGVPHVHHVHGHTATEVSRGWFARFTGLIERMSLSRAAAVIAVSPTASDYIQRWGVPAERVHLIPNGVPARKNLPQRPSPAAVLTLGMIALLRPRKGLEVLLEAVAMLSRAGTPVKLHVVGGFENLSYKQQMRRLADELGIASLIEWRGFRRDITAELDELDLLVLPSVLPEGMPMVLLEALASGIPLIGSNVDGITDVLRDGHNGLLAEAGNPTALAQAVTAIQTEKYDWQRLRRNAVADHAAKFSDVAMATGLAQIYRQVLKP
jgi:glycosyltransferase involved in cell wall biosynthesis